MLYDNEKIDQIIDALLYKIQDLEARLEKQNTDRWQEFAVLQRTIDDLRFELKKVTDEKENKEDQP